MFVSLFVGLTQTKDFCEAFRDNGFRLDYSFEIEYGSQGQRYGIMSLVIGYDYWLINATEPENFSLHSNESAISNVLGSHYSMAFSLLTRTGRLTDYFFGFFKV